MQKKEIIYNETARKQLLVSGMYII